jgi:transitional endoplasmic reticulum ATPase
MPDQGYDLRPDVETFECFGSRVVLVDPAGILAAARAERVDLLHDATFGAPVRGVRFSVSSGARDEQPVHLLEAEIRASVGVEPAKPRLNPVMLGLVGPVGAWLVTRDPVAARIAGVGLAAADAYRRLGFDRATDVPDGRGIVTIDPHRPGATEVREDEALGLRAMVTFDEVRTVPPTGPAGGADRTIAVRAAVPSSEISGAHLRSMFCLVLEVIRELADDATDTTGLIGPNYLLSRHPGGRMTEPGRTDTVTLDQVGGLAQVVAQFREIAISFRHPKVMARWGARRPQGILMYGPPGTGKTMLARALANEIGARFREIRTPEILDKWLGASERNIKQIFRDARRYREPTVLLFDEFDSIISYAGAGQDAASQAVNAVAGIFKQEMNNLIEDNPNVIVVATTNFPHRVDDSLIRSGRFDIKMSIPLPDETGRADIFTKMIRELIAKHEVPGFQMFADDVAPRELAGLSHGMTGADIKEVLRRVQLAKAMQEATTGTLAPPISQDDLRRGIAQLRHIGPAR